MKIKFALAGLTAILALAGCAVPTQYVDMKNDNVAVMGLDYKDFENAATDMVNDMLNSQLMAHPRVCKDPQRCVLAISNIVNDTNERIDTDQLTKKIRVSLLNSGRFVVTTAIGINGAEDDMTRQSRDLRNSKMVNQSTVKKKWAGDRT